MGLVKKLWELFFGDTEMEYEKFDKIMYDIENIKWDELNIQYEYVLEMKKEESLIKIAKTSERKNQHFYPLGIIEEDNGNIEEAKNLYRKGSEVANDERAKIRLGKIFEMEKDYDNAQALYLEVLNQKFAIGYHALIKLYWRQGRKVEMLEYKNIMMSENHVLGITERMLEDINFMLESENGEIYSKLMEEGDKFVSEQKYEMGADKYTKATIYNPDAYYKLGDLYYSKISKEEGIRIFEEGFKKGATAIYEILGNIFEKQKNFEKEEDCYKRAIEKGSRAAYKNLFILYDDYGKNEDELKPFYEKAVENNVAEIMMERLYEYQAESDYKNAKILGNKIVNGNGILELSKKNIENSKKVLQEIEEKQDVDF